MATTIVLAACSGALTSENPAKQVYLLEPTSVTVSGANTESLPALAFNVTAVPGLDTDRIQAIGSDARLNHYANARWADFLPEVLGSVLRRSLLASGTFSDVKRNPDAGADDWVLSLEAQQFYGVQSSPGSTRSVEAKFEGLLTCNEQNHRVQMSASSPVHEERLSVVVRAHQQALDQATQQLVDQIRGNCL
jgi:ABC-type uncharacterized transport system auxiliary subunit